MKPAKVLYAALKRGLSEGEILHAWRNTFDMVRIDTADGDIDMVAIGSDNNGRVVEITAREKPAAG